MFMWAGVDFRYEKLSWHEKSEMDQENGTDKEAEKASRESKQWGSEKIECYETRIPKILFNLAFVTEHSMFELDVLWAN